MSEAYTRDVGRGVCRIDYDAMDALDVSTGDIAKIQADGKRWTVAKILPLYPSDEGKGIIRIDGLIRNNAKSIIGDQVTVWRVRAPPLQKATVKPSGHSQDIEEKYLADVAESLPLSVGDIMILPYFGGKLEYQVLGLQVGSAAVEVGLVTSKTVFNVEGFPPKSKESTKPVIQVIGTLTTKETNQKLQEGWRIARYLPTSTTEVGAIMEKEVQISHAVTALIPDGVTRWLDIKSGDKLDWNTASGPDGNFVMVWKVKDK